MNEQRIIAHIPLRASLPGEMEISDAVKELNKRGLQKCTEVLISGGNNSCTDCDLFGKLLDTAKTIEGVMVYADISGPNESIGTLMQIARKHGIKDYFLGLDVPDDYALRCVLAHEALVGGERLFLTIHSDSTMVRGAFLSACLERSNRVAGLCEFTGEQSVLQRLLGAAAFHRDCQVLAKQKTYDTLPKDQKDLVAGVIADAM